MSNRVVVALACASVIWLASASAAISATPRADAKKGGERIERIDDVTEYLERTRAVIASAHAGDYGKLRKPDLNRIDAAQKAIEKLLEGRDGAIELTLEEQIELANAQAALNAVIRADEKNRRVCKQVQTIGTRISTTECMTVAQREQLAELARRNIRKAEEFCIAGEGNRCVK
ncbi:MAG: hypothetical protein U1A22_04445 [Xanthomonadaceae bacterium]|nr:hypothetical protein [Xanthomonadaceae bacterium]